MCAVMQKYEEIAEARGEAKGKTEGLAEGKTKERELLRHKMILAGLSAEQIAAIMVQ